MVVDVVQMLGASHLTDGNAALWAIISIARGEFTFAFRADDLLFVFGCDKASAFSAVNQAGEGEGMDALARAIISAKDSLELPEFIFCNHGLMAGLIPFV